MTKRLSILLVITCINPGSNIFAGNIFFDDGNVHRIADDTYLHDVIWLDYNTLNNPGTHLELTEGGKTHQILPFKTSTVSINGGIVDGGNAAIDTCGNNIVMINGGILIGDIAANYKSHIFVSGGHLRDDLYAYNTGVVEVTGGHIDGILGVFNNGTIYLYGNNFSVNGNALVKGDNLRDFGSISPQTPEFLVGTVNGTLLDNSLLNTNFSIWADSNASIIIIPEPATFSLLALGVIIMGGIRKS